METTANNIVEFDATTHVFTSFPIPIANSGANSITTGPDGNLWFTESSSNNIGTFNPTTHVFATFPIITANSGADSITPGPQGSLWFVESSSNKIGKINATSHQITEFPVPAANSGLTRITAGSDGNLYFTENTTNLIGQLNPASNAFATFSIPTANSGPTNITSGPDNNIWFVETAGNKIGVIPIVSTAPGATTTTLTAAPNPSIPGLTVTFTATIATASGTPTGTITFSIDGVAQAPVTVTSVNGQPGARFSTSSLGIGSHTIVATYSGGSSFLPSTSAPLTETIVNPALVGPIVLKVQRIGVHDHPTSLVLTFNKPLNAASAQNVRNYRLLNPHGRAARITVAIYDPSRLTVTLHPALRLDLRRDYQLTVVGKPPHGVQDTTGKLLVGAGTGQPGSNFVTEVTSANLVFPSSQ